MHLPPDPDIFRVPVGPGAMHVERFGYGGAPVVLLHGFGTSAFLWRHVGPMLAVRGCTAYAIDLLGYGESDRPFDGDFGLLAQADYLDRALTALQLARSTILGVDIGGIVALRLAVARPERVERLVLVGTPSPEQLIGEGIRDLQRETARHVLSLSRGLFGSAALLSPFLREGVADERHMPPILVGRYLAPYLGREGANHLLTLAGALEPDELEDLPLETIRRPVLITRGTRDRWCPKGTAEGFVERLPNSRYEPVDEVGHLVPEEAPAELTQMIAAFVTGPSELRPPERTFSKSRA